jgi:hypothetical protein
MGKHPVEVQERAYELHMVQQIPYQKVVKILKEEFGSFAWGTLVKWRHNTDLDWEGRYREYCKNVAAATDKALVKKITPITTCIQEIREDTYQQLKTLLTLGLQDKDGYPVPIIDAKNLGQVLQGFTRLVDLEMRRMGDGKTQQAGIVQVINVIFTVIENTPGVGPVFKAHRKQITDAVYEEIKE